MGRFVGIRHHRLVFGRRNIDPGWLSSCRDRLDGRFRLGFFFLAII